MVLRPAWWEQRLAEGDRSNEVVFGAICDRQLAGVVGPSFESREKTRHKANRGDASYDLPTQETLSVLLQLLI